jgi:hypothetical protein
MFLITLIDEIAALRLRQRRILKILKEKNITQWDGLIQDGDPEFEILVKEITDRCSHQELEPSKELGKTDFPT